MSVPVTVPTIVGMACMNPGFRRDLFACSSEEQEKRKNSIMKLLSNYGLAADPDTVDRLEQLVRPLITSEASFGPKFNKATEKLSPIAKRVRNRLDKRSKNADKDPVTDDDRLFAEAMIKGILNLEPNPGSLEGACETWNDMICPIWPCDPADA